MLRPTALPAAYTSPLANILNLVKNLFVVTAKEVILEKRKGVKPKRNNEIIKLVNNLNQMELKFRLVGLNNEFSLNWSKWIINPCDNYIETENDGPISLGEINWIEINPIENKETGRLMPEIQIDQTSEVCSLLNELKIEYWVENKIIKTYANHT